MGQQLGFIAQDIQQVFPEKVWPDADGFLQTAYGDYDALFVESFRALYQRAMAQEARIQNLESENAALKQQMGAVQSELAALRKLVEALAAAKK